MFHRVLNTLLISPTRLVYLIITEQVYKKALRKNYLHITYRFATTAIACWAICTFCGRRKAIISSVALNRRYTTKNKEFLETSWINLKNLHISSLTQRFSSQSNLSVNAWITCSGLFFKITTSETSIIF